MEPTTTTHAAAAARAEGRSELWSMTPVQRAEAMWAGQLSWDQLFAWARRAPDEVPLINGEFAFIALSTPEAAEHSSPASARKFEPA
ncbi:MAG TPA: hypothetical protein VN238_01375 [Solirubrobacteraceae bacterium]|nr:hypothetical protein [Solirubrobacteraceae bacterium]